MAVGASAGGLEALGNFFAALPERTGVAFLVVQHLSPDHRSYMAELLSRKSRLPVGNARSECKVEADRVYLTPPGKLLRVYQGSILLRKIQTKDGLQLPIDVCFRSLADEFGSRAIAVVLSGTGSDGTLGVRAIKDAGGMVMVQSIESAQFDGMPRSAIGTGVADFVAEPEALASLLCEYVAHPLAARDGALLRDTAPQGSALRQIFAILRERMGVDFSLYKPATIDRRIERRMSVQRIDSLLSYVRFLERSPQETETLFNNLLICVTRFFRDRKVWDHLANEVIPLRLQALPANAPFRAWMPGCSTGEEAYSMAMIVHEALEQLGQRREVKIFATDVSRESIELASLGVYTPSMVAEIPRERLARHFVQRADGFQVRQTLRQSVVFARHDILKDPGFARMDLVCCRNLLIYFQQPQQRRVLQVLRNALLPGGVLVLGSSESLAELADRFTVLHARHRIYALRTNLRTLEVTDPPVRPAAPEALHLGRVPVPLPISRPAAADLFAREILRTVVPACFVVNENRELVQVFGNGGEYLRHPDGLLTNQLVRLTAHNIGTAVGSALHRAAQADAEFVHECVYFTHQDQKRSARLRVRPFLPPGQTGRYFLVILEEIQQPRERRRPRSSAAGADAARIRELEQELLIAREGLQATVEQLETSNEELQASNEELLASNEELQSTNEELQSVNEELHTINAENQSRIEELVNLSNEVTNLFTVANLGAIFIDHDLRLRKMASAVFKFTSLTHHDLGAPVEVLCRALDSNAVLAMINRVRERGLTEELEVLTARGLTLLVRATPFVTETGKHSGLVVTLIDVSERSRGEARLAVSERLVRGVLNAMPAHIAVVNECGLITHVNEAWERFARQNRLATGDALSVGANYFDVCRKARGQNGPEAQSVLSGMLEVLRGERPHFTHTYPCHAPGEHRWFVMQVAPIALPAPGLVITHSLIDESPTLPTSPRTP